MARAKAEAGAEVTKEAGVEARKAEETGVEGTREVGVEARRSEEAAAEGIGAEAVAAVPKLLDQEKVSVLQLLPRVGAVAARGGAMAPKAGARPARAGVTLVVPARAGVPLALSPARDGAMLAEAGALVAPKAGVLVAAAVARGGGKWQRQALAHPLLNSRSIDRAKRRFCKYRTSYYTYLTRAAGTKVRLTTNEEAMRPEKLPCCSSVTGLSF